MADLIGIDVIGLAELRKDLHALPIEVKIQVADDVSKYLQNVMRGYPPYKHVSLNDAYGGFKSDKQRRFFFAALRDGRIQVPYRRTQELARGWKIIGKREGAILANEISYAGYVQGEGTQARMMTMVGWKTTDRVLQERQARINEIMDATMKKVMRKLGLK